MPLRLIPGRNVLLHLCAYIVLPALALHWLVRRHQAPAALWLHSIPKHPLDLYKPSCWAQRQIAWQMHGAYVLIGGYYWYKVYKEYVAHNEGLEWQVRATRWQRESSDRSASRVAHVGRHRRRRGRSASRSRSAAAEAHATTQSPLPLAGWSPLIPINVHFWRCTVGMLVATAVGALWWAKLTYDAFYGGDLERMLRDHTSPITALLAPTGWLPMTQLCCGLGVYLAWARAELDRAEVAARRPGGGGGGGGLRHTDEVLCHWGLEQRWFVGHAVLNVAWMWLVYGLHDLESGSTMLMMMSIHAVMMQWRLLRADLFGGGLFVPHLMWILQASLMCTGVFSMDEWMAEEDGDNATTTTTTTTTTTMAPEQTNVRTDL